MAKFTENPILGEAYTNTLTYVADTHRFQLRANGEPYLSHLLSVSSLCLKAGCDEFTAQLALMHDVIEDILGNPESMYYLASQSVGDPSEEDILFHLAEVLDFGYEMAHAISWLSAEDDESYVNQMISVSSNRFFETIKVKDVSPETCKAILLVSAADKLDNLLGYVAMDRILPESKLKFHSDLIKIYENLSFIPDRWVDQMKSCFDQLSSIYVRYGMKVDFSKF